MTLLPAWRPADPPRHFADGDRVGLWELPNRLSVRPQDIEARERVLIPVGEEHYPDGHTVDVGRLGFGGWEVRFNVAETNGRATAGAPFDHVNGVYGVT